MLNMEVIVLLITYKKQCVEKYKKKVIIFVLDMRLKILQSIKWRRIFKKFCLHKKIIGL